MRLITIDDSGEERLAFIRAGEAAMAAPDVLRTSAATGSPPACLDAPDSARFVEAGTSRTVEAVRRIGRVE